MYGKCARLSKTVVRCIETLGMQLTVLDYRRGHIFQIVPGGFRVGPKHLSYAQQDPVSKQQKGLPNVIVTYGASNISEPSEVHCP
jgi:hypothetical protein